MKEMDIVKKDLNKLRSLSPCKGQCHVEIPVSHMDVFVSIMAAPKVIVARTRKVERMQGKVG